MRTNSSILALGLAGCVGLISSNAKADLEISASFAIHAEADFHAPLAAHGVWVNVGSYGRCWRPARVAVGWRPYCHGRWVWTDCGWYWESDEPWAWACYHYGYWVFDSAYGWIWIPGIEWAPAWVSWRIGGGYIGWAPLYPPHVRVAVASPNFVFVEAGRFHERHRPSKLVINNTTIINQTTVINNVRREQRSFEGAAAQQVVVNEGPGLEAVQKASGRKFKPTPIREAARKSPAPASLRNRNQGAREEPLSPPSRQITSPKAQPPSPAAPRQPDAVKPAPPASPPTELPPGKAKPGKPGKGKGRQSSERESEPRGKGKPDRI